LFDVEDEPSLVAAGESVLDVGNKPTRIELHESLIEGHGKNALFAAVEFDRTGEKLLELKQCAYAP
jgi:hypothetical protein